MAPEKLSHSCCGVKHAARTGSSDTYSGTIKGVRAVIISVSAGETQNGRQEREHQEQRSPCLDDTEPRSEIQQAYLTNESTYC